MFMMIFYVKTWQSVNFKHFMTIKELKIELKRLKPLRFYIARENTVMIEHFSLLIEQLHLKSSFGDPWLFICTLCIYLSLTPCSDPIYYHCSYWRKCQELCIDLWYLYVCTSSPLSYNISRNRDMVIWVSNWTELAVPHNKKLLYLVRPLWGGWFVHVICFHLKDIYEKAIKY